MRKIVVEKADRGGDDSGLFECPDTTERFYYKRSEIDNHLIEVCCCTGSDRDEKDENFIPLALSKEELLFIEEQLNIKENEFLLPHLKVKEIIEHDRKYFPVHEAITFKCYENDLEVTAHLFADTVKTIFSARYFSTYDNEIRTLGLELDNETKKRLKKELLELLKEANVQEEVSI